MRGSLGTSLSDITRGALASALLSAMLSLPCVALEIDLVPFASGLSAPIAIAYAPGEDRLYVAEQGGLIRIVESDGTLVASPFLDLSSAVSSGFEQGLLGLVFHPDHANNDYLYVNYTDLAGTTVVARFTRDGSNSVDPLSESVILTVTQPFANHNAGALAFGPNDGYLYVPLGDGGDGCDAVDSAQDPANFLGNILRLDVDGGSPYAIPTGNPFVGDVAVPDEVWAYGLRNPWRLTFDRANGDMYIGDVGQLAWEEIDYQPAASGGGENYGWDCFEGTQSSTVAPSSCSISPACPPASHTGPVHEYARTDGNCAVIGGYVYRGSQQPLLVGQYFFSDFCSRRMWSLSPVGGGSFAATSFATLAVGLPLSFGEDQDGELFLGTNSGGIYRIVAVPPDVECPATPAGGCLAPAKGFVKVKDNGADGASAKDRLVAKWLKGPATTQSNLGDPLDSTDYAFCLYAGTTAVLVSSAVIPAVGLCDGKPCWKTVSTKGYKFKDKGAANDGAFLIKLLGGDAGKSKILYKARGASIDMGAALLPLDTEDDVVVQIHGSDSAECWEMRFAPATVKRNDDDQFKAKFP